MVSHQPKPGKVHCSSSDEPSTAPRLQSARWPGLGASSSGSLCESANPREERRGLVLGRPVRSTEQSVQDDLLDSSVSCESATDEKFGRREARRAVVSATFFLLFFTRFRGRKKKDSQTMRLFRRATADPRCMYALFGLGRDQDGDQDQDKGPGYSAPDAAL